MNYIRTPSAALFVLLLFLHTSSAAQESCKLPERLQAPHHATVDWKTPYATTDSYALSLSWSPQYCAQRTLDHADQFQCIDNHFDFVVHGLWPQSKKARTIQDHPRFCKPSQLLDETLIRKYLCIMPSATLMQGEWEKHGTCAFTNPNEYFAALEKLWNRLHIPDLKMLQAKNGPHLSAGDIKRAFVAANQDTGLRENAISLLINADGFLSEIVLCYDRAFRYQTCQDNRAPSNTRVKILVP